MGTYFGISQFIVALITFIYTCCVTPDNIIPEILVIVASIAVMSTTQQLIATKKDMLFSSQWAHKAHSFGLIALCFVTTYFSSLAFSKNVNSFTANFGENIVRDNEVYVFLALALATVINVCFTLYPFMHMKDMGKAYLLAIPWFFFTGWCVYAFWAGILQWLILIGLGALVFALLPAGGVIIIVIIKD